jgi:hypothetical protein
VEFVIIPAVALLASLLTFFSGFGLGTILLPAFAIFFPINIAVALTAIVHLKKQVGRMKLIIFDLDQTLVDFITVHDEVTRRLFSEYFNINARLTEIDFAGKSLKDNFRVPGSALRSEAGLSFSKLEGLPPGIESY